jgi:hypothetical protein
MRFGESECVENRLRSSSSVGSRLGYDIVWRYWRGTSCPEIAKGLCFGEVDCSDEEDGDEHGWW